MRSHVQYMITESNKEGRIYIYDDRGAATISNQFATASDVASILGVSRSTAYRLMKQLARYEVEDLREPEELHTYNVVKRSDLDTLERAARGNPHFAESLYQRKLAKRPRKKKVDN